VQAHAQAAVHSFGLHHASAAAMPAAAQETAANARERKQGPLHTHLRRLVKVKELPGHAPLHRAQRVAAAVREAAHAARLELEARLAPLLWLPGLQPART
jgi:hypothetical protein